LTQQNSLWAGSSDQLCKPAATSALAARGYRAACLLSGRSGPRTQPAGDETPCSADERNAKWLYTTTITERPFDPHRSADWLLVHVPTVDRPRIGGFAARGSERTRGCSTVFEESGTRKGAALRQHLCDLPRREIKSMNRLYSSTAFALALMFVVPAWAQTSPNPYRPSPSQTGAIHAICTIHVTACPLRTAAWTRTCPVRAAGSLPAPG
jgi:hypothetical protein